MRRLWRIARTEVLEHRRQPWMLFILAFNYALWTLAFGVGFWLVDQLAGSPEHLATFKSQLRVLGIEYDTVVRGAAASWGAVAFTNLPLYVAIMSGTSVLHDRESGTMPFLMLAPITRAQLLLGKLLGAVAIPLLLHVVFVGLGSLAMGRLAALQPYAYLFGASGAWWVAFLVGAPASSLFVGALGTVISARSRDVRTSMQFTSFFIGLLSLGFGAVLVNGLTEGLPLQVGFAMGCVLAAAGTLGAGARLLSADVGTG